MHVSTYPLADVDPLALVDAALADVLAPLTEADVDTVAPVFSPVDVDPAPPPPGTLTVTHPVAPTATATITQALLMQSRFATERPLVN